MSVCIFISRFEGTRGEKNQIFRTLTLSRETKRPPNFPVISAKKLQAVKKARPKPSLKIRTASAIFWIYLGGKAQKIFLFRNKTFLYFKIESWNFQYLFEIEFGETSKNCNSFSVFRQLLFSFFLMVVWLTWNFVRFHEILFQTDSERFRLLSWKKKFYP